MFIARGGTSAICFALLLQMLADSSVAQPDNAIKGEIETAVTEEVLKRWDRVTHEELQAMSALPVRRFALPDPGIDIMRAIVDEAYEISGIGSDTVTLQGWIAVKHGTPNLIANATVPRWGFVNIDTEFVGMHLAGKSDLFGDIIVTLNKARPSLGVVGAWTSDDVPEAAKKLEGLKRLAQQKVLPGFGGVDIIIDEKDGKQQLIPRLPDGSDPLDRDNLEQKYRPSIPNLNSSCALAFAARACNCAANLNIKIQMVNLGLTLTTPNPVYMFSSVETIPPVGYTATVTLMPAKLEMNGREFGTLRHAEVRFRELVEHVPFQNSVTYDQRLTEDRADIEE